jgi:hypothetical protein
MHYPSSRPGIWQKRFVADRKAKVKVGFENQSDVCDCQLVCGFLPLRGRRQQKSYF